MPPRLCLSSVSGWVFQEAQGLDIEDTQKFFNWTQTKKYTLWFLSIIIFKLQTHVQVKTLKPYWEYTVKSKSPSHPSLRVSQSPSWGNHNHWFLACTSELNCACSGVEFAVSRVYRQKGKNWRLCICADFLDDQGPYCFVWTSDNLPQTHQHQI